MGIKSKSAVQALFETGDKPSQQDFADLVDSAVFIPTNTTFPGIVTIEATASASTIGYGTVGKQILTASVTASAQSILAGTIGVNLLNAATTASALGNIGLSNTIAGAVIGSAADQIVTYSSAGNISGLSEAITGHIESPTNKQYTLDRYAAYPYQVEWIAVKTSAGRITTALKVEGSAMVGMTAVKASATEVLASAGAGKSVALGNTLILECSGNSAGADLVFTIKVTRTP